MNYRDVRFSRNADERLTRSKRIPLAAWLLAAGIAFSSMAFPRMANAQDTIKVGILHSLSGTMAISETTLKDTILMMIDAQNKNCALLGKNLVPKVVDAA